MPWKIETLGGTVNGSNKDFTISNPAVPETLLVFLNGVPMERVQSQPETMEVAYVQSGTNLTLGLAPVSGQVPWARYFWIS